MKKNLALKILNLILLVLFINQAVTVLFREKISPEAFASFHKAGGTLLLALIVLHLILNFNWLKANYFQGKIHFKCLKVTRRFTLGK